MLDTGFNQAAGLQSLALQSGPRVIAVTNHGDTQGELPLLWNLCACLVELGYPVVVLDATTFETTNNPGLKQLLEDFQWPRGEGLGSMPWSVLPAALGLKQLCTQKPLHASALTPISGLLQNFGVIVVYASADVLSDLLPDSGVEPLLTVSSVKMSPITAYKALKQLLLNAKLRPTMASVVTDSRSGRPMAGNSVVRNLQDCAMTFLGYRLDALTVREQPVGEHPFDDIRRLALRLLENALPLRQSCILGRH